MALKNNNMETTLSNAIASATLHNSRGGTAQLADYAGRYIYLYFWSSWAINVGRKHMDIINKLSVNYKDRNIKFICLAIHSNHSSDQRNLESSAQYGSKEVDFLVADDDTSATLEKAYGIRSFPKALVIAPNGNILDNMTAPRWEVIHEIVEKLPL